MIGLEARFWPKVERHGPDECWPWIGARNGAGYGHLGAGRQGEGTLAAHRVAFTLSLGPIPDGLCVLHRCDNPPCCNPAHLFLGTNGDNSRDMATKGRAHQGSKLRVEDIVAIRERVARGERQAALARDYGISAATVCELVGRKIWRRVA